MKTRFGLVLTIATLAVSASARGADAGPASPAPSGTGSADVSVLPTGRVPPPPKGKRPSMIPASEKVPGFFLAKPKHMGRGGGDYVVLASTAQGAKDVAQGMGFGASVGARDTCFAEAQSFGDESDDAEAAWTPTLQPNVMFNAAIDQSGRPRVLAVHSERLVQEPGVTSLEVADAWIDPVTRGVRLIGRSTLPLARVTTILGGSTVFAGRDDRTVHVILTASPNQDARHAQQQQLFAAVDGTVASSQCGYLRVGLATEKGQGRTATFVNDLQLSTLDPQGKLLPKDRPSDTARFTGAVLGAPIDRPENRFRPVHVHASVSWASRDKEALLTVASGWDARERTQPF
jgi:hypothetical protein